MRQVRTCDFCGDDASGLYEPLPASVPDGPRMLLCDGCRDRLGSVVDPLVAQLEGGTAERSPTDRADGGSRPADEPEGTTDDATSPASPPTSVSESRDASGRSQGDRAGTPRNYRKVMRFLENRQLPMERTEAVAFVSDAYDLEEGAVEEALDHAVEYGRLREVSGELKR